MGVVHKLKPEILSFIIENKRKNPALSCRNLTSLIVEQFQINVSKSSINAIFKENNLSMPIGRRPKPKKSKFKMPVLPVIEDVKTATLVEEPIRPIQEQVVNLPETAKEEPGLEEMRGKEAKEQAIKLQEEERIRAQEKLRLEKQRLKDEEIKIKTEEAAKKIEQERLAKEVEEFARQTEEAKKLLIAEAELKAERERWVKLAEEEHKSKHLAEKKEVSLQKNEFDVSGVLPWDRVCSGAMFLKVIDYLIGGSKQINEIISKKTGNNPEDLAVFTEAAIFRSLFGKNNFTLLCSLIGQQISQEKLDNYCSKIKQINDISLDVTRIISDVFTEARGVKLHFIDGNIVYLDGQLHTTWSTPYLPYDFTSTVYDLKNNLNKYFFQAQPLVLLSAPGYDVPTKEFFNLFSNISSKNKGLDTLILYDNDLKEFESISVNQKDKHFLVFGLWPWQFTSCRKIKKIGNFVLEHIEGVDKDFYLAEIEMDLLQPSTSQSISLRGCAVKTDPKDKIRVVILSNNQDLVNLNKLVQLYLSHWSNLEEGFQDFSRKVEIFTYSDNSKNFFSTEEFGLSITKTSLDLEETFVKYIKILDAYLRWHFLPAGYKEKDFSFTNECFYNIPIQLSTSQYRIIAQMQINQPNLPLKDLEYLLRRLNERQINLSNDKVLYFENAFK